MLKNAAEIAQELLAAAKEKRQLPASQIIQGIEAIASASKPYAYPSNPGLLTKFLDEYTKHFTGHEPASVISALHAHALGDMSFNGGKPVSERFDSHPNYKVRHDLPPGVDLGNHLKNEASQNAKSGNWDEALKLAKMVNRSKHGMAYNWNYLPQWHPPESAVKEIAEHLRKLPLTTRQDFWLEYTHHLPEDASSEILDLALDNVKGDQLAEDNILSHPNYKPDLVKAAKLDVAKFWHGYEIGVEPEHFATIHHLVSGQPQSLTDHRGRQGSSEGYVHLIPHFDAYAKDVQREVLADPDIPKRMFNGEPHVQVFRGIAGNYAEKIRKAFNLDPETGFVDDKALTVPMSPLSSWTTDVGIAHNFARRQIHGHPNGRGLVIKRWMPVSKLLHSGFHDIVPGAEHAHPHEQELIFRHDEPRMKIKPSNIHHYDYSKKFSLGPDTGAVQTSHFLSVNARKKPQTPEAIEKKLKKAEEPEDEIDRLIRSAQTKADLSLIMKMNGLKSRHLASILDVYPTDESDTVVKHPKADSGLIDLMLSDPVKYGLAWEHLKDHPALNSEHFHKLADFVGTSNPASFVTDIFKDKRAPTEVLNRVVASDHLTSDRVVDLVLHHPNSNSTTLQAYGESVLRNPWKANYIPGHGILSDPRMPSTLLAKIFDKNIGSGSSADLRNLAPVLRNPSFPKEKLQDVIRSWPVNRTSGEILPLVARNPQLSSDDLSHLLKSGHHSAQMAVAENPSLKPEHIDQLLDGTQKREIGLDVLWRALHHPTAVTEAHVDRILREGNEEGRKEYGIDPRRALRTAGAKPRHLDWVFDHADNPDTLKSILEDEKLRDRIHPHHIDKVFEFGKKTLGKYPATSDLLSFVGDYSELSPEQAQALLHLGVVGNEFSHYDRYVVRSALQNNAMTPEAIGNVYDNIPSDRIDSKQSFSGDIVEHDKTPARVLGAIAYQNEIDGDTVVNQKSKILDALAKNPNTPSEFLKQFMDHGTFSQRNSAAANPGGDASTVEFALSHENRRIRVAALRNPNLTSDQIRGVVMDPKNRGDLSGHEIGYALTHPNTPSDVLEAVSHGKVVDSRYQNHDSILEHPNVSLDLLRSYLTRDPQEFGSMTPQSVDNIKQKVRWELSLHDPDSLNGIKTTVKTAKGIGKIRKARDIVLDQNPKTKELPASKLPPGEWGFARLPNGNISADKLQEAIDKSPTMTYNVSSGSWNGVQRHNRENSRVFQLNMTSAQVADMKNQGVWSSFVKMHKRFWTDAHPVNYTTIGWVRHTGNPKNGYFIDEIQSDHLRGLRDESIPLEHRQKISQILFGGRHPSEVLMEGFLQRLRDKKLYKTPVHVHSVDSQFKKVSDENHLNADRPPPAHMNVSYHDVPKNQGFEPSTYGELSSVETGQSLKGQKTWAGKVRKFEGQLGQWLRKAIPTHDLSHIFESTSLNQPIDHEAMANAHPKSANEQHRLFHSVAVNHPSVAPVGTSNKGISSKSIVHIHDPESGEHLGRVMLKPFYETTPPGVYDAAPNPLGGWAELTNQNLYHAAGLGEHHQKAFLYNHDMGDGTKQPLLAIHMEKGVEPYFRNEERVSKDQADVARKIGVMDFLTGNFDRHGNNLMVHKDTGKLLAIDHGLGFQYGIDRTADVKDAPPPPDNQPWKEQFNHYWFDRAPQSIAGDYLGEHSSPEERASAHQNFKPVFEWWKQNSRAIRDTMDKHLSYIKDPGLKERIRRNFNARADFLDKTAAKPNPGWGASSVPQYHPNLALENFDAPQHSVAKDPTGWHQSWGKKPEFSSPKPMISGILPSGENQSGSEASRSSTPVQRLKRK